jgi:thioredoxin-related protein
MFISSRHTCKYCVILEDETLSDPDVIKELNKDFISVVSYSDDNDYIPQELWRPGTPAIWFLNPDGSPMYQPLMGAYPKEPFLYALSVVKKEFKKNKESGKKK